MAMGQQSRRSAPPSRRTSTGTPIRSQALWIPLLGLVTTALLGLPALGRTPVVWAQAAPAPAVAPELYYGLVYPGAPDIPTLRTYETKIGKGVSIVMWYQAWDEYNQMQAFPTAQLEAVREHGSIPMLAWEPAANPGPLNQPAFSLAKIADGTYDTYLRHYAEQVKAWGHPFFLRFASEMNGSWTSWYEGNSGNSAGQFVRAWRHVHDIFTAVGATNASWVWCPNDADAYTTPLEELYPGNAYVDWAGIDGYNFSVDLDGAPWRSFATIFRATYQQLLRLLPPTMPILIGETGSVEDGGSKAGWITDALSVELPKAFPRIKALVWFEDTDDNLNLRFDTSPSSLAAFQKAIAAPAYQPNKYSTLDQSPIPPPEQVLLPSPATLPAASTPSVVTSYFSGPSPGTIEVLDFGDNQPVSGARLVYERDPTSKTRLITKTNSSGVTAAPSGDPHLMLERIVVGTVVIPIALALNLQRGYQITIDLATAKVTQILVHIPLDLWPLVLEIALFAVLVIVLLTLFFRRLRQRKRQREDVAPEGGYPPRRYPTLSSRPGSGLSRW